MFVPLMAMPVTPSLPAAPSIRVQTRLPLGLYLTRYASCAPELDLPFNPVAATPAT